ncbi:MAG: glycosyltransferase [Planctomycetes bacterium]|nr:glycosyltransferase [Planctomycetota bacterium]
MATASPVPTPPHPLVTVVTPTFRSAPFLEDAIRSVLAQDCGPIEYIVVDGGDDAETPAIVDRHGAGVTHYLREPDGGQAAAINKGFRRARGDVLAWLNADDYYFPGAVSTALACFQADPGLDVLYGDAVFCDADGQFLRYFTEVEPFDATRLLGLSNYICQPAAFFRRAALERVRGLDESLHFVMDWDLWCRFARAGCRFRYEPRPLAVNREHAATKTRRGAWRRIREILRLGARYDRRHLPLGALHYMAWELDKDFGIGATLPRVLRHSAGWLRGVKRALAGRRAIRSLYGLHHHDPGVEGEAVIHLPLPARGASAIRLLGEFPVAGEEQTVEVDVEDRPAGRITLQGGSGPRWHELAVGDLTPGSAPSFHFRSRNRFRRPGGEAAWLLHAFRVR